jgi:hypothetical protein
MLTGEVKKFLGKLLADRVLQHQQSRARVSEEIVDAFMTVRELNFKK